MPNAMSTRPARVGSAFAWEVTKHTTERDREIAWLLYRQKILMTDQLRLLFFGSLRRCQDRLLWLYRHRVIDRFYPAGPFSLGKPPAHWLLDEVGAHLVAARLGRERKSLGTPSGLVGVAVEWDRATEPMATLIGKISRYQLTLERSQHRHNVCFVVPDERRAQRLCQEGRREAQQVLNVCFWVTTTNALETHGPLGGIWRPLDQPDRLDGMAHFEALHGAATTPCEQALGRRWQAPMRERWAALSPLRAPTRPKNTQALRSDAGSGLLDLQLDHEQEEPWR